MQRWLTSKPLLSDVDYGYLANARTGYSILTSVDSHKIRHGHAHALRPAVQESSGFSSFRKAAKKRTRASPSAFLQQILGENHIFHAFYDASRHGHDLSYKNSLKIRNWKRPRDTIYRPALRIQEHDKRLQYIIALYVDTFGTTGNTREFSPEPGSIKLIDSTPELAHTTGILSSKGYTWQDVQLWHNILVDKDEVLASKKLLAHSPTLRSPGVKERPIPLVVFLFFLRRPQLAPEAFRNVLSYAWSQARPIRDPVSDRRSDNNKCSESPKRRYSPVADRSTMTIMVVRLLRHARKAMPEAFVSIARLFLTIPTFDVDVRASWRKRNRQKRAATRVNALFNRVLKLLSLPPLIHPFHSVKFMQQAQFDILEFMASHKPIIQINREGYRAISSVQLANKKSERDLDWASLKAKSWPPWKVDKMGFDAEKGPQYGVSRAYEAIQRAQEAGYGSKIWERTATVLAGWDLDGSPTIQTRAFHLHRYVLLRAHGNNEKCLPPLWTARIQATRTVDEAWACFLAYEKEIAGITIPHQSVYFAMLQKLHFEHVVERRRSQTLHDPTSNNVDLGGDGKEVLPVSPYTAEQTYVHTPAPPMDELANQMWARNIRPSIDCISFLISNAQSFKNGLKYLEWACHRHPSLVCLIHSDLEDCDKINQVPLKLFDAYVELLCKYANNPQAALLKRNAGRCEIVVDEPPIFLAYRFLRKRKVNSQSAWYKVAYKMMSSKLPKELQGNVNGDTEFEILQRWGFVRSIRNQMRQKDGLRLDSRGFVIFNKCLSKAILSAYKIQNSLSGRNQTEREKLANVALRTSGRYAEGMFHELFGVEDGNASSDEWDVGCDLKLLTSPYPSVLHGYVRNLGLLQDWQRLENTVQWMVIHHEEIERAIEMPGNGPRMLRRTLIAIRVFLERAWLSRDKKTANGADYSLPLPKTAAPLQTTERIRVLIEKVEGWGGWPSDQEVYVYCHIASEFPFE